MKDKFMSRYFKLLIKYKCLGTLCFTTVFEIIRGILMTSGVAWGINWITEGCMKSDSKVFMRGNVFFVGSIITSVILVFIIEWVKKCKIIKLSSMLRYDCITKAYSGDYSQVKQIDKSEWMYRINNNIQQISDLFGVIQLSVGGIGKIAGSLISGFVLSWHLTIVLLAYGLIKICIDKTMMVKLYKVHRQINEQKAGAYSLILQMVQGLSFYKYLADNDWVDKKFNDKMDNYKEENVKAVKIDQNINTVYKITEAAALLSVLLLGAQLADKQIITMGAFVSFVSIYDTLINPFRFIGDFLREYQKSKVGCNNILAVLNIRELSERKVKEATFYKCPYELCVKNIDFSYDKEILHQVSFKAKSGEITYIVGKSGCGKSTLFNIIGGLLNANSGEIYIKDKEGRRIELNPSYVTYISQEPFLFNGTIKENICMQNDEEIDDTKLNEAIEKAGCQAFINSLSQGLDHCICDRGNNFSGGQKCRLALARVFYHPTPIILVDELYAHIDNAMAAKIEISINELVQNNNYCALSIIHREEWIPKAATIVQLGR